MASRSNKSVSLFLAKNLAKQCRPYRCVAELRQCVTFLSGHAVTRVTRYGLRFFYILLTTGASVELFTAPTTQFCNPALDNIF